MKLVCGLKLIGGQFVPPSAPGETAVNSLRLIGAKMQPSLYGLPSGALPEKSDLLAHCVANASPTGYGCVGQVFCSLFCGTFFSTMPTSGSIVSRSSRYSQPVLHASPTPFRSSPSMFTSNRIGGDGQS